ncbi:MAG: carboxymuconolactone decarboxylase family protein [Planctomycetota bacterium]
MPRINPVTSENAQPAAQQTLDAIKGKLGMVPNLYATLAHSPASLNALLGFGETLGKGVLGAGVREQIAVAIAGANSCQYCASAHTAIGQNLKLDAGELARNLQGQATDPKVQAILTFAVAINERRGWAGDALETARAAGLTDEEIIETLAVVSQNIFTNYANHLFGTEVDFPVVEVREPASA